VRRRRRGADLRPDRGPGVPAGAAAARRARGSRRARASTSTRGPGRGLRRERHGATHRAADPDRRGRPQGEADRGVRRRTPRLDVEFQPWVPLMKRSTRGLMSETFERILELVEEREIRISDHGYDELMQDGILAREILTGVVEGLVIEDYPN